VQGQILALVYRQKFFKRVELFPLRSQAVTKRQRHSSQEEAATIDMSAAVQQTLSVVSGASAFGATTNVDMLLQRAKQVAKPKTTHPYYY